MGDVPHSSDTITWIRTDDLSEFDKPVWHLQSVLGCGREDIARKLVQAMQAGVLEPHEDRELTYYVDRKFLAAFDANVEAEEQRQEAFTEDLRRARARHAKAKRAA